MVSIIFIAIVIAGAGWLAWRRWTYWRTPSEPLPSAASAPQTRAFEAFAHGNRCLMAGQWADVTAAFEQARSWIRNGRMWPSGWPKSTGGNTPPAPWPPSRPEGNREARWCRRWSSGDAGGGRAALAGTSPVAIPGQRGRPARALRGLRVSRGGVVCGHAWQGGARMRSMVRHFGAAFVILVGAVSAACGADPALPYGINAHLPSGVLLDRVAAAGIAWVRVDFNWVMMEPARGVYDWATTDAVVGEARARGLNIYATLAYTPAWAAGGQAPNTPPLDPRDWYAFVYTTVSRYRDGIRHWGMWNEPNFAHFFRGSPAQYIDSILRVGAQAVRDADPGGSVLGPELAQEGDWWQWLYRVLAQAAEAIDIVTQHSYQDTGEDVLRRLGGPVEPWERPTVRDVMRWTGTEDKALWLTETGWNTADVSEEAQAAYYEQVLAGGDGEEWLDKVFFYQHVDEPDSADEWGILRADLSPKLAYEAYQRHIAAQGAAAARRSRAVDHGVRPE